MNCIGDDTLRLCQDVDTQTCPCTLQKLLDIKGFSDAKVDKLLESAKALKNTGFMSGTEG